MTDVSHIPILVGRLYEIVSELEARFPGRKFTPDGHLVGSLGEVLAASRYGLELLPNSTQRHDATDSAGRLIQIKATQGKSVAMRSEPDFLIVLALRPDGSFDEIYNGPGSAPWENRGKTGSNGQASIGVSRLRTLNAAVPDSDRIATRTITTLAADERS